MAREREEPSMADIARNNSDSSLLQRLKLRFRKQPTKPPEKSLRVEPIAPYPINLHGLDIFESFEHPLPYHKRYDALAAGIEQLHKSGPKVRKEFVEGQVIRPRNPHHGFTTYVLDWGRTSLPLGVRDFLKEGNETSRVNISTQAFNTPLIETAYFTDSTFKYPVLDKKEARGEWIVGQNYHRMLWVGGPKGDVELHVRKGEYYYDDIPNTFCPEVEIDFKYLTIGEDGMYKHQEDPRNFHSTNSPLSSTQIFISRGLLQFATSERIRLG